MDRCFISVVSIVVRVGSLLGLPSILKRMHTKRYSNPPVSTHDQDTSSTPGDSPLALLSRLTGCPSNNG